MSFLESIRRWIDGEAADDPFADTNNQAQPRRVWEEFFVQVAREIEAVMRREMFTPPGGPTYIPREYIVYLSNEDDRDWQGEKRRGLEQGLFHVLSERAAQLSGQGQLAADSFAVELRVDGTLNKGEFRVQPVWDTTESNQTMVLPRPAAAAAGKTNVAALAANDDDDNVTGALPESTEGDITQVRPRHVELYSIEIWRGGVREQVIPVSKAEITIGRGSQSVKVDLPIKGDPEVSRLHATLTRDAAGGYWLTSKGRNPTFVAGQEIPREEPVSVRPDNKIEISTFTLRIQPH